MSPRLSGFRLSGLRLATRLTVVFVVAAAVVGAIGGLVVARQLVLGLDGGLDTGLRARSQSLQGTLGANPSPATARRLVSGTPGLTQVVTSSGRVIATSAGAGPVALLDADQRSRAMTGTYIIDASRQLPLGAGGGSGSVSLRLLGAPIPGSEDLLVLGTSRGTVDDAVRDTAVDLLILGIVGLAVATLGVRAVIGAALRPIERARVQAARASGMESKVVLPVPGGDDELSRLVVTLNDLLGRHYDALEAERLFTADAGHELRTPLTILAGELELAARPGRDEADLRAALVIAREETDRLIRLAEQLLLLARGDNGALVISERCDLTEVVRDAVGASHALALAANVEVTVSAPPVAPAELDPTRIRLAVENLVRNALTYAPPGSAVEVSLVADGDEWSISVRDHGTGFDPEFLPHAFERFRRSDPSRPRPVGPGRELEGAGLGLAIVHSVARAHGGTAVATNAVDGGAIVSIVVPRVFSGARS